MSAFIALKRTYPAFLSSPKELPSIAEGIVQFLFAVGAIKSAVPSMQPCPYYPNTYSSIHLHDQLSGKA
ncbi:MAG: hypothetical protein D3903_18810 [Candidatus Electrothrix sp. GM3_4]|nr:hypothetical protein [Candidatus Electrothrix sp. GM3_4]